MGRVRSFIIDGDGFPSRRISSYKHTQRAGDGLTEGGVYVLAYQDGDSFTSTRNGTTNLNYSEETIADEDKVGRTFELETVRESKATLVVSAKTELFNGFTTTASGSNAVERTDTTKQSNVTNWTEKTFLELRSTIRSDTDGLTTHTYSLSGQVTAAKTLNGSFEAYATATMIGDIEDSDYTGVTTRTNLTTMLGQSWFTTAEDSKRTTTSSTYPRPVTITDTVKYTGKYFSRGILDTVTVSQFANVTTEGPQARFYLNFNLLETANSVYEEGVFAWAYNANSGDDGLPRKQGPQEDFYSLKTAQGDRWENVITISGSQVDYVAEEDEIGETVSTVLPVGFPIRSLTYNAAQDSTGTLQAQGGASTFTIERGQGLTTYTTSGNAQTVAPVPMLSFVTKGSYYTTFLGKIVIPLITKEVRASFATDFFFGQVNASGQGSETSEANGITTTRTFSVSNKIKAGPVTTYGTKRYGTLSIPALPVGGVGKFKSAAGFVGFGNTSLPLSKQGSFWRTSSFKGLSTNSQFTAGNTGSLTLTDLPQFFTERMGPRQTILDLNDRCQSTHTFVLVAEEGEVTVTTVATESTGATLTIKNVTFDNQGKTSVATSTSRVDAWMTETTTTASTYLGSVSYKWLQQPTSKSAMTSRELAVTVRDEKLQEVRGTRTVALGSGVAANKGEWAELPTIAIGHTGIVNGALYEEAILTWCHAVVDMTAKNAKGKTSTLQKSQGNGNSVYTFDLKGIGVIVNPRPVAFAGAGGDGHVTVPFFPKDVGQSPVGVGRIEYEEETV
jgi:hypothetical protein